jgi:hypothetical protein
MNKPGVGPHLVPKPHSKQCSVCGKEFQLDVKPSLSQAFAEHVRKQHSRIIPGGNANQSAARFVTQIKEKE